MSDATRFGPIKKAVPDAVPKPPPSKGSPSASPAGCICGVSSSGVYAGGDGWTEAAACFLDPLRPQRAPPPAPQIHLHPYAASPYPQQRGFWSESMHPDKLLLGAAALKYQNHISRPPFATLFLLFLLSFEVQVCGIPKPIRRSKLTLVESAFDCK